jgi:hypothetical protein
MARVRPIRISATLLTDHVVDNRIHTQAVRHAVILRSTAVGDTFIRATRQPGLDRLLACENPRITFAVEAFCVNCKM